jgi:hypothetical protein
VSSLTPPGAEPHDFELTPTDVAAIADAALVVFFSGFQPAVDEATGGARARYSTPPVPLRKDLETLDDEFSAGLADCADKNLVTSHKRLRVSRPALRNGAGRHHWAHARGGTITERHR